MSQKQRTRIIGLGVVAGLGLAAALLAGCTQASTTTTAKAGATALGNLAKAQSALSTTSPDAKLLVVQTAQPVTTTATPVWGYLFGSPSTDKTYMVYVSNGQSMGAKEYGTTGLSKDEWAKVPGSEAWKVDSDAALAKALPLSGAKGAPAAYVMGLLTYKPKNDTSTVEPFVWNVQFDPGSSGATSKTILVNATTGAASVSK
jgi:hypothetical protein